MSGATIEAAGVKEILEALPHRYPFLMVDRVIELNGDESAIGIKNVTFNEPQFMGHFPGQPVFPGVLMIEGMAQTAGVMCIASGIVGKAKAVYFMTIDKAKFRRPVGPGDVIEYHMKKKTRRKNMWWYQAEAKVAGELGGRSGSRRDADRGVMLAIDPTARVAPGAVIGANVEIGPYCVIGPHVAIGDDCKLIAHVHLAGHTTIGAGTTIYPFASLGTPPQSVHYKGEPTRLLVGARCQIRESVTINTGTQGGGGVTTVGDDCFLMVGSHIGHDCQVGRGVIIANNTVLGGHCHVGDHVFLGGHCAVHQHVHIGEGVNGRGILGICGRCHSLRLRAATRCPPRRHQCRGDAPPRRQQGYDTRRAASLLAAVRRRGRSSRHASMRPRPSSAMCPRSRRSSRSSARSARGPSC